MFDNFRDDSSTSFYQDDDDQFFTGEDVESTPVAASSRRKKNKSSKFLGMTDVQRFVIAIMLMVAVCTLGTMCLLITGKIGLI